jgi:hypothetical protein
MSWIHDSTIITDSSDIENLSACQESGGMLQAGKLSLKFLWWWWTSIKTILLDVQKTASQSDVRCVFLYTAPPLIFETTDLFQ